MIKVNNKKVVSEVAVTTYKANKKRNLLTIFAIVLTTFLIMVVFAIGISYWDTISLRQVRMNGMDYDIELTEPKESQVDIIRAMDKVETAGLSVKCGIVETYKEKELGKVQLYWLDQTAWEDQCIPALETVTGSYPVEENEIMLSDRVLNEMEITDPEIGMELPMECYALSQDNDNQETFNEDFVLSGYFRDYTGTQKGFVSEEFFVRTGAKQTDLTQGELLISLKNPIYSEKDIDTIQNAISLGKVQSIVADYDTISSFIKMAVVLMGFLIMILITGYLFIYNSLYISITKDIRYYGQLKTIGMTSKQLRAIITKTVLWNSLIGIPIGLILGIAVANGVIPQILHIVNPTLDAYEIASVQPWVCILAAAFSFLTNLISSRKPAKIAGDCSPIEAIKYVNKSGDRMMKQSEGGGVFSMAFRNIFRDKKQAFVIFLSFIIAGTIFFIINVVVKENEAKSILNATYTYDIEIKNETTLDNKQALITKGKIDQIGKISGVKNVGVVSSTKAVVPYQEDVFGEYYKNLYQSRWTPGGDYEEDIESYKENPEDSLFTTRFIGIDSVEFKKINTSLGNVLDEKEFEEGKIAVIDNFLHIEMGDMVGKSVNFSIPDSLHPDEKQTIRIAAITQNSPAYFAGGYTPVLIVSEEYANQLIGELFVELINVEYEEAYSKSTEEKVKDIYANEEQITIESKLERYAEMVQTETQVKVLGISIIVIIGLLAALNYFNMAAAGVQSRSKEFAILESIGMTTKQIKKMLTLEGIVYAAISIVFSILIGIPLSYIVFQNMNIYRLSYTIPWLNNILLFMVVLTLCILIPVIIYQRTQTDSIITRLRKEEE